LRRHVLSFPTRRSSDLLRWAGIGFLVGLGFWIDPLVLYALLTIALWIGGYFIFQLVKPDQQTATQTRIALLKEALLFGVAIPTRDRKSTRLNSSHASTS